MKECVKQEVSTKLAIGVVRMLLYLAKPENRNETEYDVLIKVAGDAAEGCYDGKEVPKMFLGVFIEQAIPNSVSDAQIHKVVKGDYSEVCGKIAPFLDHFFYPAPNPEDVHP